MSWFNDSFPESYNAGTIINYKLYLGRFGDLSILVTKYWKITKPSKRWPRSSLIFGVNSYDLMTTFQLWVWWNMSIVVQNWHQGSFVSSPTCVFHKILTKWIWFLTKHYIYWLKRIQTLIENVLYVCLMLKYYYITHCHNIFRFHYSILDISQKN